MVAAAIEDDGVPFEEKMEKLTATLLEQMEDYTTSRVRNTVSHVAYNERQERTRQLR